MYLWIYAVFVHLCYFQKTNACVCAYLYDCQVNICISVWSGLVCWPICAYMLHLTETFMYFCMSPVFSMPISVFMPGLCKRAAQCDKYPVGGGGAVRGSQSGGK